MMYTCCIHTHICYLSFYLCGCVLVDVKAVATAQHFGVVGNGKQYILGVTPQHIQPIAEFETKVNPYRYLSYHYNVHVRNKSKVYLTDVYCILLYN